MLVFGDSAVVREDVGEVEEMGGSGVPVLDDSTMVDEDGGGGVFEVVGNLG